MKSCSYIVDRLVFNPKPKKPYRKRPLTVGIAAHHSKGPGSPEAIAAYHVRKKGYPGIGYHGVIYRGEAYQTAALDLAIYHAWKHNDSRIAICFAGNYDRDLLPAADLAAGARFIAEILERYALPESGVLTGPWWGRGPVLSPHRGLRWSSEKRNAYGIPTKTCPGDLFPLRRLVLEVEKIRADVDSLDGFGIVFPE